MNMVSEIDQCMKTLLQRYEDKAESPEYIKLVKRYFEIKESIK